MSTLNVGQIQDLSGKPLVKPTGSILQVVNINTVGQTGNVTTTSVSYVTTGFSLSITPFSASSKLLVTSNFQTLFGGGGVDDGSAFKIYRDGTAINTANSGDCLLYSNDTPGNGYSKQTIIHYVNSNSTNPTTFELYFSNQWGGTTYLNRDWGTNNITIMEIAA